MYSLYVILIALTISCLVMADNIQQVTPATQTSAAPQPAYQPQDPVTGYVPHATYPYADTYGPAAGYEGYLVPAAGSQYSAPHGNYKSSIVPTAQVSSNVNHFHWTFMCFGYTKGHQLHFSKSNAFLLFDII